MFRRLRQPRRVSTAPSEPRQIPTGFRGQSGAVADNRRKLGAVAGRQWGVASLGQLQRRGIADAVVRRWIASQRLYPLWRGVLSTVPPSLLSIEGRHAAAILAGGRDACLCADSAGWWVSLIKQRPPEIHVAVRSDLTPVEGIRWHRLSLTDGERVKHSGMPITALERIPLDLAKDMSLWDLKGVLAELEFHHDIRPDRLTLRRGYPGAAKLRRAIGEHTPELAHTRSELERAFINFLDTRGFALPVFNAGVSRTTVDAIYEAEGVVIELDGARGHAGDRRILRDHRRDLHRRADGLLPIRYHYTQLVTRADQDLIEAELDRLGIPRTVASPFQVTAL